MQLFKVMCEGIEYVDFLFKNILRKIVHKPATAINIVILCQKLSQISKITSFLLIKICPNAKIIKTI